jgi:methylated-DNA-[protein]-cysteine S-methyltransferase
MTHPRGKPATCVAIADDLLAAAMGEAGARAARHVEEHVSRCASCRRELETYREVDGAVASLRDRPPEAGGLDRTRERLEVRLSDLRRRLLRYRIFPSPLGPMLIARSEEGIALIEYLPGRTLQGSRVSREPGVELVEDHGELDGVYRELLDYLHGRRKSLEWPLDLRFARSDFQRAVLAATAALPYGAVIPYTGIAQGLGRASAVRAVAQALRWNPLPIVIPCHRVIGNSGALTGYAGGKVDLKQRLLSVEGIPTAMRGRALGIVPQEMYWLYPGDREYCTPACPSIATHPSAPFTRFASREVAEAAGLRPCTTCRPDLHPIP